MEEPRVLSSNRGRCRKSSSLSLPCTKIPSSLSTIFADDISRQLCFFLSVSRHPAPFDILATPRTPACSELIRHVEIEFPWDSCDAETIASIDWKKYAGRT